MMGKERNNVSGVIAATFAGMQVVGFNNGIISVFPSCIESGFGPCDYIADNG